MTDPGSEALCGLHRLGDGDPPDDPRRFDQGDQLPALALDEGTSPAWPASHRMCSSRKRTTVPRLGVARQLGGARVERHEILAARRLTARRAAPHSRSMLLSNTATSLPKHRPKW
ncbi:MAG: hypothetical protein GY856_36475 [bacterium]|nr:hypothetical protein [bacterium]